MQQAVVTLLLLEQLLLEDLLLLVPLAISRLVLQQVAWATCRTLLTPWLVVLCPAMPCRTLQQQLLLA